MLSKLLGGAIKYALSLSEVLDRKFAHRHAELLQSCPTVARQAPLSVISRQEHQSRVLCPPPGDLFDPGIELTSPVTPALKADSLPLSHQGSNAYCLSFLPLLSRSSCVRLCVIP